MYDPMKCSPSTQIVSRTSPQQLLVASIRRQSAKQTFKRLNRVTLLVITLATLLSLSSAVYASCQLDPRVQVDIIIRLPPNTRIGNTRIVSMTDDNGERFLYINYL